MNASNKWREHTLLNPNFYKEVFFQQLGKGFRSSGRTYIKDWVKDCSDIAKEAEGHLKQYYSSKGGENGENLD